MMKINIKTGFFRIIPVLLAAASLSMLPSCNRQKTVSTGTGITNAEKLGFPKDSKVLILHCDDAGMCEEANIAVKNYFQTGDIRSAAVMVPCDFAMDLVEWAKTLDEPDLGVHLTHTSEWKTWRWGTVADPAQVPGLIDPDGKMWRSVPEVIIHATAEEIETEARAQIDKVIAAGYRPSHIDTHMGTMYGSADNVKAFLKIAEEYGIPANAIDLSDEEVVDFFRKSGYPLTPEVVDILAGYSLPKLDFFSSVPDGDSYENKRENFFRLVASLKPGLTEIIFHPSVETDNLKTITGSWQQRVWEAQLFSDPVVKEFFTDNGIIITNWREVMTRHENKKQQ